MGRRTGWTHAMWQVALAAALAFGALPAPVQAQDVFFTQSGGRGLQNAKMSARVSKVEADTKDLQTEMAKIQPFAKKEIISCVGPGDKLRWTGNDWLCDSETDPTVQAFAKKALPTCSGGQILSASGSDFNCVNPGFLSAETDPTVQGFAKAPLPSCGTGELLKSSGDSLACATDERGLTQETDPYVHSFARTDMATIQNCEAGKVLTMLGNRLECVFDAVGITVETDPKVQPFAKNDIPGYTLNACATGEILTAATQSGVTILKCDTGAGVVGPVISNTKLNDLLDVVAASPNADDVLRFNGTNWVNSDDKIGSGINTRWCYFNSTEIVCDRAIPAPMPAASCAADEMISWNDGTETWECIDVGDAIGGALALGDLSDVSITTPLSDGMGLTYDGTKWVQGYDARIVRYNTDMRVIDSSGGNGAAQIVVDGISLLTARGGNVGIGINTPTTALEVNGVVSATQGVFAQSLQAGTLYSTNGAGISGTTYLETLRTASNTYVGQDLYVSGSLYVSGAQTIEGVTFANGGVSATGTISATRFVGDGSGLTGIGRADRIISGTTFVETTNDSSITMVTDGALRVLVGENGRVGIGKDVPATELEVSGTVSATNLRLSGNLYVSGSQTIDGVTFANGGVSATGTVTATSFSGDGSGLSGIDKDRIISGTSRIVVNNNGSISFTANNNQKVTIDANGNLGIGGQTTPVNNNPLYVTAAGDVTNFMVEAPGISGNSAFELVGPLSNNIGNGKAFSIRVGGETYGRSIFYTDGSFGVGPGSATRDVFLSRPYANTFRISSDRANGAADLEVTRTISATNLRLSGNLYVSGSQTIDGVTFANGGVSATGTVTATSFSGDGSGLTGIDKDRIVSGTTNIIASNGGSLTFSTAGGQRAIIDTTGNMGVGLASPNAKLDVNGTVSATGLAIAGNQTLSGNLTGPALVSTTQGGVVSATYGYFTNVSGTQGYFPVATITALSAGSIGANSVSSSLVSATNISATLVDATRNGTVSGTYGYFTYLSGTQIYGTFTGDGSGLTGVTAGATDRIVSGTGGNTSMVAVSATGYISVTQGGYNTAWFHPSTGLVAVGVSATGPISGTAGYFGGLVVPGTVTGPTLISTSVGGIVSATYGYFGNVSGTQGYFPAATITALSAGSIGANSVSSSLVSATNISATLVDVTRNGTVSGTYGYFRYISGTQIYGTFVGDGSGLSGVTAGATDRIVSGTGGATSMVAISDTGYISVTQGGYNTAWFHPSTGLVAVGVSATGPISGTDGYYRGRVTVDNPTFVSNSLLVGSGVTGLATYPGAPWLPVATIQTDASTSNSRLLFMGHRSGGTWNGFMSVGACGQYTSLCWAMGSGSTAYTALKNFGTTLLIGGDGMSGYADDGKFTHVAFGNTGNVGIKTINPSQTFHVSGTALTTSWTYINAAVNVRVTPTAPLEVSGTVSATAFVGDGSGLTNLSVQGDRIVSGSANAIANLNTGISTSVSVDVSGSMRVSGTVKVAGTGSETCAAAAYGAIRLNPTTGAIQVCRQ